MQKIYRGMQLPLRKQVIRMPLAAQSSTPQSLAAFLRIIFTYKERMSVAVLLFREPKLPKQDPRTGNLF